MSALAPPSAVIAEDERITHLPVHLFDRRPCVNGVIAHFGKLKSGFRIRVFQIRQIYVNDSVEQFEDFDRIISVGVVNDRQI